MEDTRSGDDSPRSIACEHLADLAVETWRLGRWVSALDHRQAAPGRRFLREVEEFLLAAGFSVLDLTGTPYHAGLPLDVVDIVVGQGNEADVIHETIVPIVQRDGQLFRHGQVVVSSTL